jgi:hypothetical protein
VLRRTTTVSKATRWCRLLVDSRVADADDDGAGADRGRRH